MYRHSRLTLSLQLHANEVQLRTAHIFERVGREGSGPQRRAFRRMRKIAAVDGDAAVDVPPH